MKPAIVIASLALLLFAWMCRYEVSGYVGNGEGGPSRPVVLDRWTGTVYIYTGGPTFGYKSN